MSKQLTPGKVEASEEDDRCRQGAGAGAGAGGGNDFWQQDKNGILQRLAPF